MEQRVSQLAMNFDRLAPERRYSRAHISSDAEALLLRQWITFGTERTIGGAPPA